MCGRATFTIVVSSTTMSWAVRMTNRSSEGSAEVAPKRPGGSPG